MSDIVERLTANLDKYPGFQNLNTEAAAEITRLRDELAAWKAEAMAARHFISMGRIEAWQPDEFHPGIPTHIEVQSARAANGENTNG